MSVQLICDDVMAGLRGIPDHSVNMAVTSPPYYSLRSYGIAPRQWPDGSTSVLGEEDSLEEYIAHLVLIFGELKRVMHPTGTFWLNMGDCYASGGKHVEQVKYANCEKPVRKRQARLTGKDLLMVPARVAIALQDNGWILRNDIIWAKGVSFCKTFSGSVMPESTRDRCTWSHEHVFHFALNKDYFYDQDGCREPYAESTLSEVRGKDYQGQGRKAYAAAGAQNPSDVKRRVLAAVASGGGRNLRNVWVIHKQNYKGAHMATFPEALIDPIVKLGTSEKGACPHCHAQWIRRTIREAIPSEIKAQFEASREATVAATGRTDGHTHRKPNFRRAILGTDWEPGCKCSSNNPIPATILDPFSGSGRAGIVATRLGRTYIGIDASAEYCELARRGINEVNTSISDESTIYAEHSMDHIHLGAN